MAFLTTEDVINRDQEVLGQDLGPLYTALKNEYSILKIKHQEYYTLYGSKSSIIELDKFASFFFYKLQEIMFNDIVLHISRMIENKRTANKQVLSLQWLPDKITDSDRKHEVQKLVDECIKKCEFTRNRRNKYIAHRDYELFMRIKPYDLTVKNEEIKQAIDAIWKIINYIESNFFKSSTMERMVTPPSGAIELMQKIRYLNKIGYKPYSEEDIMNAIVKGVRNGAENF